MATEAPEAARGPTASSRSTLKLGAFLNSTQLASHEMARSRQLAKWLMLHCHAATPVLSVLGRTFATVTAKAQQHSGASSTSLDVATRSALPMWGNAELSTAAALEARVRLRDDSDVLGELHLWWLMAQNSIMPSILFLASGTPSPRHAIANEFSKANYVSLACLIANAMTQGRGAATVRAAAEEDWKADADDPSAAMNYWSFIDRVFELADGWTECCEAPQYVEFLSSLRSRIGELRPDGGWSWRSLAEVTYAGYEQRACKLDRVETTIGLGASKSSDALLALGCTLPSHHGTSATAASIARSPSNVNGAIQARLLRVPPSPLHPSSSQPPLSLPRAPSPPALPKPTSSVTWPPPDKPSLITQPHLTPLITPLRRPGPKSDLGLLEAVLGGVPSATTTPGEGQHTSGGKGDARARGSTGRGVGSTGAREQSASGRGAGVGSREHDSAGNMVDAAPSTSNIAGGDGQGTTAAAEGDVHERVEHHHQGPRCYPSADHQPSSVDGLPEARKAAGPGAASTRMHSTNGGRGLVHMQPLPARVASDEEDTLEVALLKQNTKRRFHSQPFHTTMTPLDVFERQRQFDALCRSASKKGSKANISISRPASMPVLGRPKTASIAGSIEKRRMQEARNADVPIWLSIQRAPIVSHSPRASLSRPASADQKPRLEAGSPEGRGFPSRMLLESRPPKGAPKHTAPRVYFTSFAHRRPGTIRTAMPSDPAASSAAATPPTLPPRPKSAVYLVRVPIKP